VHAPSATPSQSEGDGLASKMTRPETLSVGNTARILSMLGTRLRLAHLTQTDNRVFAIPEMRGLRTLYPAALPHVRSPGEVEDGAAIVVTTSLVPLATH
jgi:hypothetical protein